MRPYLHGDAHGNFATGGVSETPPAWSLPFLRHYRSLLVNYTHAALLVGQVDSHISAGFPKAGFLICLLMNWSPCSAPFGRAICSTTGGSLLHATQGDQSSHSIFEAVEGCEIPQNIRADQFIRLTGA
jgi:hypothetical protein